MSASMPSVKTLIPTKPPAVSRNRTEPRPVIIFAKAITSDPDAAAVGSQLDTIESTPRPRSPTRLSNTLLTATVSYHVAYQHQHTQMATKSQASQSVLGDSPSAESDRVHGRPLGPSIRSTNTCSVGRGTGSARAISSEVTALSGSAVLLLGARRLKT
jgi:hypothetical protein